MGDCHEAHIFPYSLGKTQEKAALDIWKVLEMFWGLERKDQLQQLIFGQRDTTISTSKTQINALHNIITLSPEVHTRLGPRKVHLGAARRRRQPIRFGGNVSMDAPETRKPPGT